MSILIIRPDEEKNRSLEWRFAACDSRPNPEIRGRINLENCNFIYSLGDEFIIPDWALHFFPSNMKFYVCSISENIEDCKTILELTNRKFN
jgi:hypothetical protein